MNQEEFEKILDNLCKQLTLEASINIFDSSKKFENRVREVAQGLVKNTNSIIDFDPHPQAFPDIAVGEFGIEVKFSESDTWRSIANSVLERNRIEQVKKIYLVFGKMGGVAEVKWGEYEKCVMHVRTSHVPRFEVELYPEKSLFDQMETTYDAFRSSTMEDKMLLIRAYARSRLKEGERLWWLDSTPDDRHSFQMQARLYTKLSSDEKLKLRAEAALMCPSIVAGGRARNKYDDAVMYLLTYHGVLCHQARDLFSAGSVANPNNDNDGGIYIERSLKIIEREMEEASFRLEDGLFVEYWGEFVKPDDRLSWWLEKADFFARDWIPSQSLFQNYQINRKTRK